VLGFEACNKLRPEDKATALYLAKAVAYQAENPSPDTLTWLQGE
jgi:hypothetical protein